MTLPKNLIDAARAALKAARELIVNHEMDLVDGSLDDVRAFDRGQMVLEALIDAAEAAAVRDPEETQP